MLTSALHSLRQEGVYEKRFCLLIDLTLCRFALPDPGILSPKYGQMCNVKPLTANHSLSFSVKSPNLNLKVSNFSNALLYVFVKPLTLQSPRSRLHISYTNCTCGSKQLSLTAAGPFQVS